MTTIAATSPLMIEATSVSGAWSQIMLHISANSGTQITPLIVSIHGFDRNGQLQEYEPLRAAVDDLYKLKGKLSIEDVAFTIFPNSYWEIAKRDRKEFFSLYRDSFPRMQAMNSRLNRRGLYFERMIDFGDCPCDGNQLEWIISQFNSREGVRKSMFQASIFDPVRDHVADAQLGFPCLQHVSFEPTKAGLVLNAFYATQQIFDKAFGNYLGLTQLGNFMASQFGMPLARTNIFVGIAKLERISKTDRDLTNVLRIVHKAITNNSPETHFHKNVEVLV